MTEIRLFRDDDQPALIALWEACGLTRPWNPPAGDIALLRSSGHGELLLAVDGESLAGSVMVGHDGHRGWVYYLAVAPGRRERGLGRQLTRAAEAWLSSRGVRKIELMVRDCNATALSFYGKLGYNREPVIVMSRWLVGTQR